MTKTEAADIMATDVVVWARQAGVEVTKDLVAARVSEWRGDTPQYNGTVKQVAAKIANVRTVLRFARQMVKANQPEAAPDATQAERVAQLAAKLGWTEVTLDEVIHLFEYRRRDRYVTCRFDALGRCLSVHTGRHRYRTAADAFAVLRGEKY